MRGKVQKRGWEVIDRPPQVVGRKELKDEDNEKGQNKQNKQKKHKTSEKELGATRKEVGKALIVKKLMMFRQKQL